MLDSTLAQALDPARPRKQGARLLIMSVLLTASIATACGRGEPPAAAQQGAAPQRQATPVKTIVLRSTEIPNSSEYVGTLKSRRSIDLNPQVDGQITEIFVKSGDVVKAGAPAHAD